MELQCSSLRTCWIASRPCATAWLYFIKGGSCSRVRLPNLRTACSGAAISLRLKSRAWPPSRCSRAFLASARLSRGLAGYAWSPIATCARSSLTPSSAAAVLCCASHASNRVSTPSTEIISSSTMAQRRGSPFTGISTVFLKEFADHLGGARMLVLEWLVLLTGIGAIYTAIQDLRTTTAEDPFLFLRLFTHAREPLPSFVS